MVIEIRVIDEISPVLASDVSAQKLFEIINEQDDADIIIDFRAIDLMTISFAQEYTYQKSISKKNITEKNLLKKDKELLELSKDTYN